jgi:hypothetical protein
MGVFEPPPVNALVAGPSHLIAARHASQAKKAANMAAAKVREECREATTNITQHTYAAPRLQPVLCSIPDIRRRASGSRTSVETSGKRVCIDIQRMVLKYVAAQNRDQASHPSAARHPGHKGAGESWRPKAKSYIPPRPIARSTHAEPPKPT